MFLCFYEVNTCVQAHESVHYLTKEIEKELGSFSFCYFSCYLYINKLLTGLIPALLTTIAVSAKSCSIILIPLSLEMSKESYVPAQAYLFDTSIYHSKAILPGRCGSEMELSVPMKRTSHEGKAILL